MNALNRDRMDDLRRNTARPAPVSSPLCYDCWAKTPEGMAGEKDKFGTSKTESPTATEPAAAATPDYTKVGGWLIFFGILAGAVFLLHLLGFIIKNDRWMETLQGAYASDAGVFEFVRGIGLPLLPLLALGQCVCIFRRQRAGRTLSLFFYGSLVLTAVIDLLTMKARISADMQRYDVDFMTIAWPMYLGAFGSIIIHGLPFAYFLKSERVKKTLVN